MSLEKKPIKTLVVTTGFSCNNKCLMCSVDEKQCAFPNRTYNDIESDLKIGRLDGFTEVELTGGEPTIRKDILENIQKDLYDRALERRIQKTKSVDSYDEFKKIMETTRGFISAHWCEDKDCEAQIKTDTKATTRCLPLDAEEVEGKCVRCGAPSHHRWLFGLSY